MQHATTRHHTHLLKENTSSGSRWFDWSVRSSLVRCSCVCNSSPAAGALCGLVCTHQAHKKMPCWAALP